MNGNPKFPGIGSAFFGAVFEGLFGARPVSSKFMATPRVAGGHDLCEQLGDVAVLGSCRSQAWEFFCHACGGSFFFPPRPRRGPVDLCGLPAKRVAGLELGDCQSGEHLAGSFRHKIVCGFLVHGLSGALPGAPGRTVGALYSAITFLGSTAGLGRAKRANSSDAQRRPAGGVDARGTPGKLVAAGNLLAGFTRRFQCG